MVNCFNFNPFYFSDQNVFLKQETNNIKPTKINAKKIPSSDSTPSNCVNN